MANIEPSFVFDSTIELPSEPFPIPSIVSNEEDESFVVLGNSLTAENEDGTIVNNNDSELLQPIQTHIIEEAENLIKLEISHISKSYSTPCVPKNDVSLNVVSTMSQDELRKYIDGIIEENERLKFIIGENNTSMKKMKEQLHKIAKWQDKVQLVYQGHKEKFSEAKIFINNLKAENAKFKTVIENNEAQLSLLVKEISSLKKKINHQNKEESKSRIKENETVQQENEVLKEEYVKLNVIKFLEMDKQNIEIMEEKLQSNSTLIQKLNLDLSLEKCKAIEMESMLKEEIQLLKSQLDEQTHNSEEIKQLKQQLMNSQITITEMQHQINENDSKNSNKEKECQEVVQQLQKEDDDTFALKTQLEIYKTDFDSQKQSYLLMKQNRDQIAEDLKLLQKRNQQLLEEIEILRNRGPPFISSLLRTTSMSNAEASPSSNSPPFLRYSCPVCDIKFRSLRLIEDHLERCIK